jgi:hypothetical protein
MDGGWMKQPPGKFLKNLLIKFNKTQNKEPHWQLCSEILDPQGEGPVFSTTRVFQNDPTHFKFHFSFS